MYNPDLYFKTLRFAANAHKQQCYPGTDLPYVLHMVNVSSEACLALQFKNSYNADVLMQAALLHDVIEDTDITYDEVSNIFGKKIADGVLALTKNEKLQMNLRMDDSLNRILQSPPEIGMVKMADRISNLNEPPEYWPNEKRILYLQEAVKIHKTLKHLNTYLEKRLFIKIDNYKQYINGLSY